MKLIVITVSVNDKCTCTQHNNGHLPQRILNFTGANFLEAISSMQAKLKPQDDVQWINMITYDNVQ